MSERKDVVLVLMRATFLDDMISSLNSERVKIAAILKYGSDDNSIKVGEETVPLYSFQSIEKLLVDKEKFLWLIGG